MTIRDFILTDFGTLVLHNGTSRRALDRVQEVSRAQTQIITLPSGTKYDNMLAADVAPSVPGTVTTEIRITGTKAANQTALGNIAANLGVRGTLTFKQVDSATTYTATARMTAVRNLTPADVRNFLLVQVTFELLTNPA